MPDEGFRVGGGLPALSNRKGDATLCKHGSLTVSVRTNATKGDATLYKHGSLRVSVKMGDCNPELSRIQICVDLSSVFVGFVYVSAAQTLDCKGPSPRSIPQIAMPKAREHSRHENKLDRRAVRREAFLIQTGAAGS